MSPCGDSRRCRLVAAQDNVAMWRLKMISQCGDSAFASPSILIFSNYVLSSLYCCCYLFLLIDITNYSFICCCDGPRNIEGYFQAVNENPCYKGARTSAMEEVLVGMGCVRTEVIVAAAIRKKQAWHACHFFLHPKSISGFANGDESEDRLVPLDG